MGEEEKEELDCFLRVLVGLLDDQEVSDDLLLE